MKNGQGFYQAKIGRIDYQEIELREQQKKINVVLNKSKSFICKVTNNPLQAV
jgi:hypothetical protein